MKKHTELLERIRQETGLDYISDLSFLSPHSCSKVAKVICNFEKNAYSLEEWEEAVKYITKTKRHFSTIEEAIQFLSKI